MIKQQKVQIKDTENILKVQPTKPRPIIHHYLATLKKITDINRNLCKFHFPLAFSETKLRENAH